MKILLINPPIPEFFYNREYYLPSSLMYLAASLRESNKEVKILDFRTFQGKNQEPSEEFYEKKLIDKISDFQPDLIGITCLFSGNFQDVLKLSEAVKKRFKHIPICIGGLHPTIYAKDILKNCPSIDFIILGEGEETIVKLAENMQSGNLDDVDGLTFRRNEEIVLNPKKRYITDIDGIPFPAYEMVNFENYYVDTEKWYNPKGLSFRTSAPIISSRSCPNRCTFCSMFMAMGPAWRARTPKNVVDEIEFLYEKYGQNHFSFMDDNLTLNKQRVIEICDEIKKRKLNIQFETPNGVSVKTIDEEVLDALVSAGLIRIFLAIESGSDFIRNEVMRKRLPREKIYEVVNLTKKYKQLFVKTFFIIGMPEETKETLEDTYQMIKEIKVNAVALEKIVPYPGTEVFAQAQRDNLLVNIDFENLYKQSDMYFMDYNRFFIKPYKLSVNDLREFRTKCNNLIAKQKATKRR